MKTIDKNTLFELLDARKGLPYGIFGDKFHEWAKISNEEFESLEPVGLFEADPNSEPLAIANGQSKDYWGADLPIDLDDYPYSKCKLYRFPEEGDYYFVYREMGGNAAELRCRLIRSELLVRG